MSYDPDAYGYTGSYNPWIAAQARQRARRRGNLYPGVAHHPTTYDLPGDLRGASPTPYPMAAPGGRGPVVHPPTNPSPLSFYQQGDERARNEVNAAIGALPLASVVQAPFEQHSQDLAGIQQAWQNLAQQAQHATVDTTTGLVQQQQAAGSLYDQIAANQGGAGPSVSSVAASIPTAAYGTNSANAITATLGAGLAAQQGYQAQNRQDEAQAIYDQITQPQAQLAAQIPTLAGQYADQLQGRADQQQARHDQLAQQAWERGYQTRRDRADTWQAKVARDAQAQADARNFAEDRRRDQRDYLAGRQDKAADLGVQRAGLAQQWDLATLDATTKEKLAYVDAQIAQAKAAGDHAWQRQLEIMRESFRSSESAKTRQAQDSRLNKTIAAGDRRSQASIRAADRRAQASAQRSQDAADQRLQGQGLTAWRQALNDAYGTVDDNLKGVTVTGSSQGGPGVRARYEVLTNPDTGATTTKTFHGTQAEWDALRKNGNIIKVYSTVGEPQSSRSTKKVTGRSYYAAIQSAATRLKQIRDAYRLPYSDAEITQIVQGYANPKFKAVGLMPGRSTTTPSRDSQRDRSPGRRTP